MEHHICMTLAICAGGQSHRNWQDSSSTRFVTARCHSDNGKHYRHEAGRGRIAQELAVFFLNTLCVSEVSFAQWEAIQQRILKGYNAKQHLSHLDQAMIVVFIVNGIVARAQYSVELAHEVHMTIDWKDI